MIASLRPGTNLGNYQLAREIGRGARGVVYEAVHRSLRRRVALKVVAIQGHGANAEHARARFLREGRAAARVRHAHVVDVFDCHVESGFAFLAMELVDGETLAQRLEREGRLPLAAAVDLLLPILSAVAELHAAGITHRDIKPANILLARGRDPCPKLADFGVAHIDDGSAPLTQSGFLLGTPEYIAPEILRGHEADERSDQYALGVTLYEMVTGAKPFERGIWALERRSAPRASSREASLPRAFDLVVQRAMHPDSSARFATIDAMAAALGRFAAGTGAAALDRRRMSFEDDEDDRPRHEHEDTREPVDATLSSRFERADGAPGYIGATLPSDSEQRRRGASRSDLSDNARMARALGVGIFVWCAYFLLDLLVEARLHVASIQFFVTLRLVVLSIGLLTLAQLRQPTLRARGRIALDLLVSGAASGAIAIMCVPFWGIESPYASGICVTLVLRVLYADESWRRGLVMYGIPAGTYPVVMAVAAAFDPALAHQFRDAHALTLFVLNLAFVFGTAIFATAGGHMVWALRRAVSEARNMGRYKLRRRIGRGATGDVWLAHHAALKRDVAIKILRPDAVDEVSVPRFEREVRATAELAHPNTVRIFDFGATDDGLWYYAMEFLEGETLTELVHREGPLTAVRATHIASQVAHALGEAHWHGIVHRDIKPSNLFITAVGSERDFVKVLDFGIARFAVASRTGDATLTRDGHILGTPAYISPEAAGGREVDARADVYALGAVLYFMITAHPPFETHEGGALGLLMAHVSQVPAAPSVRLGLPVPQALEAIVMRCLAKAPGDRFPDASALAAALDASRAGHDGAGDRARSPESFQGTIENARFSS